MDDTLKPLKFPIDYLTFILTLFTLLGASIVFMFTTFETKVEAERTRVEMSATLKELHDDLGDVRKEMNAKLDQLIRDQK